MNTLVRQALSDRGWQYQLLRYCTIGALVFAVDFTILRMLLSARLPLPAAVSIAYCIGVCTHFSLNKYWNFRNHDRPVQHQAVTYAIVVVFCYLTTLGIIEGLVTYVGVSALAAKVCAVAFNAPIGFLAHRYLTFGSGIAGAIRELSARRPGQ